MTLRAAVLVAVCLLLAMPVAALDMPGCDEPGKPNRPKLDPVYLTKPEDIYKKEAKRVFDLLEKLEGYPGELGVEAVVGFISREKTGLGAVARSFAKGVAWQRAGEADNARYHFLEAVKADPRAYSSWAGLFMVTPGDKANAAIELFREASAASPRSPEPYNIIASYQALVRAQHGAAVETLEAGIRAIPKPPEYLYQNQAVYIIASPDFAGRLDTLKRNAELLARVGETPVNLYINGVWRYLAGDYAGSVAHFRKITEKFSGSMPGFYGLAEATFCAGDADEALRHGEAAYRLMSDSETKNKFRARLDAYRKEAGVVPAP